MQEVYKTIGRVAASDVSVLLRGESGTGKEVVARALHHYSRRAGRPFVGISAAAIPVTLLESELFGHEKGAFTDAKERRLGKLELAHGGTVFFDEIGDMPAELQVKLLRALQERAFERVGGHELIRMDVRVLAATHRDLEAMMKRGPLPRGPLLPPQRGDAVAARRCASGAATSRCSSSTSSPSTPSPSASAWSPPDAMDRLVGHDWPGNVRELENVIQRAMVMALVGRDPARAPADRARCPRRPRWRTDAIARGRSSSGRCTSACAGLRGHASANLHGLMVGLVEKPLLRAVMRETKGNQVRAAQLLGINRNTLRKKLKEHGIDPDAV